MIIKLKWPTIIIKKETASRAFNSFEFQSQLLSYDLCFEMAKLRPTLDS